LRRGKIRDNLPPAICLVIFPIPRYITHSALRYRHSIDPVMTILAVYAIGCLCSAAGPRRKVPATPISG
jgi:hypothetical protein